MYACKLDHSLLIVKEDPESYVNVKLYPVPSKYVNYIDETWSYEITDDNVIFFTNDLEKLKTKFIEKIKNLKKEALIKQLCINEKICVNYSLDLKISLETVKAELEKGIVEVKTFKFSNLIWEQLTLDLCTEVLEKINTYVQRCIDAEYEYFLKINNSTFDELFELNLEGHWPSTILTEI